MGFPEREVLIIIAPGYRMVAAGNHPVIVSG
jgi:hypothetical protein